jgi:VanZ family protein
MLALQTLCLHIEYDLRPASEAMSDKFSMRNAIAILAILGVIALSVAPASVRPVTGLGQTIEHALCFFALGAVVAYALSLSLLQSMTAGIAFASIVELAQIPVPSRHARVSDFVIDAVAICTGIVITRLLMSLRRA